MMDHPGLLGAAITLGSIIIGGLIKILGSPGERAAANVSEVEVADRVVELAYRQAQRSDEQTQRTLAELNAAKAEIAMTAAERDAAYDERDDCKDSLRKMDERLTAQAEMLRAQANIVTEHNKCGPRITALTEELNASKEDREWMTMAIDAAFEGKPKPPRKSEGSTPPPNQMPAPNQVAALATPKKKET